MVVLHLTEKLDSAKFVSYQMEGGLNMNSLLKIMIIALFILIGIIAVVRNGNAGDDILYGKVVPYNQKNTDGQHCIIKQIIKQKGDIIEREEIMECADGRKRLDGPSYWEIFAEFYYRDVNQPEYCRHYSRNNHAFKTHGKTCLTLNGRWEIK